MSAGAIINSHVLLRIDVLLTSLPLILQVGKIGSLLLDRVAVRLGHRRWRDAAELRRRAVLLQLLIM